MGKVLAYDGWDGGVSRIYVAYPDRSSAEQWASDPDLLIWLYLLRLEEHELGIGWGYPHYSTPDYVITIARVIYGPPRNNSEGEDRQR